MTDELFNIPVSCPDITSEDALEVLDCVRSSWVGGTSPWVKKFEKAFASWVGTKEAVVTGSGTTAGHLLLAGHEIKPGDQIIIPSFTMIATANIVRYLGAIPIFADCDPETWCIDPESVRSLVNEETKAIIAVHIYGHPCDMGSLQEIAYDNDILLIEDAAEAHGARYKNRMTGSLADGGFFSFYPNKIITTGEGGAITTDDEDLAERLRWLRAHAFGQEGKHYWHEEIGYGYRMSGLQASLGLSQLRRADEYVKHRRYCAWRYKGQLGNVALQGKVTLPIERDYAKNTYWMFSMLIEPEFGMNRDEIVKALSDRGIETRTFFYPLHTMPAAIVEGAFRASHCKTTNDIAKRGLNLPSGNTLTDEQIDYIGSVVRELAK